MKTIKIIRLIILISAFTQISCSEVREFLYVGTFSQRGSQGLYVYEFDRSSNTFSLLQTMPEILRPNFLAIHPSKNYLYAVNIAKDESGNNQDVISSFIIDKETGVLSFLNQKKTFGGGACHVSLDNEGKWAFVSHYRTGDMSVFPVYSNGELGDTLQTITFEGSSVTPRQLAAHVHSILVSPDNKFVYVADLGTDKLMIYSLDNSTGRLTPAPQAFYSSTPGAGPRHFIFNSTGSIIYVADELSSTVSVLKRNPENGSLQLMQTISTLPEGFDELNTVADIHKDSSGKFLYVSNRGHNSLAIYKVRDNGELTFLTHEPTLGNHPRNFMVDPKGDFVLVANAFTDNVPFFNRDKSTGILTYSGMSLDIPSAVCLKWLIIK